MIEEKKRYTFKKEERISSKKKIEAIFATGKSFISYPLRVVFLKHEQSTKNRCSILVTVPKKRIKNAVDRNRIKRLIRETYRLNKDLIANIDLEDKSLDVAFVYVKDTVSSYSEIEKAMLKALKQLVIRAQRTEKREQTN